MKYNTLGWLMFLLSPTILVSIILGVHSFNPNAPEIVAAIVLFTFCLMILFIGLLIITDQY